MKHLFLLPYLAFVFLMIGTVYKLMRMGKSKETMLGLFMTFLIVPDFILFDAYGIPGTFVLVFFFMCLVPSICIIKGRVLHIQNSDLPVIIMLLILLGYALYTNLVIGVTTDYFNKKLFGYVYTLLIPMIIVIHYKDLIIKTYDTWKPIFLYAILAYVFKNFSLVGILGFRETYLFNYEALKNVIFAAQLLSIGAIICAYDVVRKSDLVTLLYLGILLLQVLLFESRGPILSAICTLIIIWWFKIEKNKNRFSFVINPKMILGMAVFIVVSLIIAKYLWDSGYLARIVTKMEMLSTNNFREARAYIYPITIEAITQCFPFGIGFGNSNIAITRINSFFDIDYPHNLILELLLEEGFFISILFFMLFIKWFCSILVKDKYTYHTLLFYSLFAFSFLCSMFSGDIGGNRNVILFGYLAWSSKLLAETEYKAIYNSKVESIV